MKFEFVPDHRVAFHWHRIAKALAGGRKDVEHRLAVMR